MTNRESQQIKAKQFYQLHHTGKMLIFPNIWDSLGANLIESLNYPAIATASASISYTKAYFDGENVPFNDFLQLLTKIVNSVHIPVSADIESGYATTEKQLEENIKQLVNTGIVGINIEDTDKKTNSLIPIETQCNRIRLIKNVSAEMGVSLFINARTDIYIQDEDYNTPEAKLEETIKRGLAYKNAGADCFYPIVMKQESDIKKTVEQLQMPINILTIPGIPALETLQKLGVARVSLGPSFLKIAMKAMKDLAVKLQNFEGLSDITENDVTNDYLKSLIAKNY